VNAPTNASAASPETGATLDDAVGSAGDPADTGAGPSLASLGVGGMVAQLLQAESWETLTRARIRTSVLASLEWQDRGFTAGQDVEFRDIVEHEFELAQQARRAMEPAPDSSSDDSDSRSLDGMLQDYMEERY